MYPISHFLTQHFTHIIYIDNCPFLPDKIYRIETVISIISPTKTVIEATQLQSFMAEPRAFTWLHRRRQKLCQDFVTVKLSATSWLEAGWGNSGTSIDPASQNTEKTTLVETIYVCLSTYLFICVSIWCVNIQMGLLCVCVCKYSTWV